MSPLTAEQQAAVEAIENAIARREHFDLKGPAGAGKTTVIAHVGRRHHGAFLCAPTGKAASVLRAKTGLPATTVHAAFYRYDKCVEDEDQPQRLVFRPLHRPGALVGKVLLIGEYCGNDRARWLYTAIARAQKRITIARSGAP